MCESIFWPSKDWPAERLGGGCDVGESLSEGTRRGKGARIDGYEVPFNLVVFLKSLVSRSGSMLNFLFIIVVVVIAGRNSRLPI